jgi:hypothetical protein
MFTKLAPQKAVHSTGYIVQVLDRFHVEYIDKHKRAKIEVDFAPVIGIYKSLLSEWEDGTPLSEPEKLEIVKKVSEALQFMGSKTEIIC